MEKKNVSRRTIWANVLLCLSANACVNARGCLSESGPPHRRLAAMQKQGERLRPGRLQQRAGQVLRVACDVTGGTLGVFFSPPHFQFCSAAITGRKEWGRNNYNFLAYAD